MDQLYNLNIITSFWYLSVIYYNCFVFLTYIIILFDILMIYCIFYQKVYYHYTIIHLYEPIYILLVVIKLEYRKKSCNMMTSKYTYFKFYNCPIKSNSYWTKNYHKLYRTYKYSSTYIHNIYHNQFLQCALK